MPVDLSPARLSAPSAEMEALVEEILNGQEDRLLEQDIALWQADLRRRLAQLQQHPELGLGFIEEHIRQASLQLQRLLVQKTLQDPPL